ncbi:MAG: guanylate kinase [Oligoflexia bacterium]|nr:guanylate kinase [Oligoflexia bacterium]
MISRLKPTLIIISAPSGAGKSTLCAKMVEDYPEIVENISYTTRPPRNKEKNNIDYFFISEAEFEAKKAQNFFIESAYVHGNHYGISKDQVENALSINRPIIFDIDVQGAKTLVKKYPDSLTVFILPPSIEELRKRLEARDKGKTQNLELRIKNAEREIKEATFFNYKIVNADLDKAYAELKKIVETELINR